MNSKIQVIETHLANSIEWALSTNGQNPGDEDYFPMSKEVAFKLAERLNSTPLTTEQLEKLGFECTSDDGHVCDWWFNQICIVSDGTYFIEDATGAKMEYVHQVQKLIAQLNQ